MSSYHLDHLEYLEAEAIHVLREVAAEFERPAILAIILMARPVRIDRMLR